VAHGYKQVEGVDFDETFATVIKSMSYKSLIVISTNNGLQIRHMDVVTAFLYDFLKEEVYIDQPEGYEIDVDTTICKLIKTLYDLKQALKVWYDTIRAFLKTLGFERIQSDHGVFVSLEGIYIVIYVDDLLIFGFNLDVISKIQEALRVKFKMTDLRTLSHYLGMEISVKNDVIILTQKNYMLKILIKFGMADCNPVTTPMKAGVANALIPSSTQTDQKTIK
jgi:virulence-associated protein VapD